MPPRLIGQIITYEAIQKLTDLSLNALHQAGGKPKPVRHPLDIQSLESVILWLARHGKRELRVQMVGLAAEALIDGDLAPGSSGTPRRPKKKAAKKRSK